MARLRPASCFVIATSLAFCAVVWLAQTTHNRIHDAALCCLFLAYSAFIVYLIEKMKRVQATLHAANDANRQMTNRLHVADELKTGYLDELSAAMAHELVQPLSSLVMDGQASLRWLRHEHPPQDEIQECVERMTSDGRRASATLKKIRDIIRRPPPDLRPVELNTLLLSALDDLRPDLRGSGIGLRLNLSSPSPTVVADERQLRLVVLNVYINAIEAMQLADRGDHELEIVSCTYDDGRVGFLVCDSGAGIRIAPVEQIFEPFVGDKAKRLGLGLSVCRSIVEAHDGLITASNNSAKGATLAITFPNPLLQPSPEG
jgi:signal transduction histidine kinase